MAPPTPHVLLVNGSVRAGGDSAALLEGVARCCTAGGATVETLTLATEDRPLGELRARFRGARAFVFGSGVYWGSWGSPLQRLLELLTPDEATPMFLGKPAGVVLSMESVGGADVAARLLHTMTLFGCQAPPLSSVVVSRTGMAVAHDPRFADVWRPDDVEVLTANLLDACGRGSSARSWGVERATLASPDAARFPCWGSLELGLPRVLPPPTRSP